MGKMKANRKFVDGEEAVSAVIGVILMVAITVAIAATVYVYVSGMMGTGQEAAPTLTFTKDDKATVNTLLVIAADPSDLSWGDIEVQNSTNASVLNHTFGTDTVTAGTILDITALAGTGAYTIGIRHVPTNTLIGTYSFTAAS
jgi:flagellin-like protein